MDEITAEIDVQSVVPQVPLTVRPHLSYGMKTDIGRVRENNEDKYEVFLTETDSELASRGQVFVVCDGMGGHEAGQIASELASKTFIEVYRTHPATEPEEAARAAIKAANRFVLDHARLIPNRRGMGTTLTGLCILQNKGLFTHVGDSRLYRLRGDQLEQLTFDHTWVEQTVRAGTMSREDAEAHPYRHVLTQAVGTEDEIQPDIVTFDLEDGDMFMLCSDGVTNHLTDEAIHTSLASGKGCFQIAWDLVAGALAGGGSDNATAVVVRVNELQAVAE
jgi:protein phosphatase